MDLSKIYHGNLDWIPERTFYLTKHGSQAYGTSTPESDLDLRGIVIPPAKYFHGYLEHFEQAESKDPDLVIFDIRKFFKLAADCNPNALEIIFTDPSDHLITKDPTQKLFDNRHLFLSRKAKHTFSGYAMSQLKRINTHYRWLSNPILVPPTRKEFNLPERTLIPKDQLEAAQSAINKQMDQWNTTGLENVDPATRIKLAEMVAEMTVSNDDKWKGAARTVGYDENFIELLDRERRYQAKKREFTQYQEWVKNRNPKRAELEAKYGFDLKHAVHLVRLLRAGGEILRGEGVKVKRPDAAELMEIRNGKWSYEQLIEWAKVEDEKLNELVKVSPLPNEPDRKKLDQLCCQIVEEFS